MPDGMYPPIQAWRPTAMGNRPGAAVTLVRLLPLGGELSLVTTQPAMLTPVASMSNGQLFAEGSDGCTRNQAGVGGDRRIERRLKGTSDFSPMEILLRLPAVVVLERIPIPALAMARDGIILFANTAFAEMMGYRLDGLAGVAFPEIFDSEPTAVAAFYGVDALANLVVELRHCEGWTVRARMSKSALMRSDDSVALMTFENLTERLWMDER
jgi:PAS domain S-box-containing protein